MDTNKLILLFQIISIPKSHLLKIHSYLGYHSMFHSIYFRAFLEISLGWCVVWTSLRVTYPPENACRISLFSNERRVVTHQCHCSSQQNACLTFSPLVQKNLAFGWKQSWLLCNALQPCSKCFIWHLCAKMWPQLSSAVMHTHFSIADQIFKMNP